MIRCLLLFTFSVALIAQGADRLRLPAPADVANPPASADKVAEGLWTVTLAKGSSTARPAPTDCVQYRFVAWKRDGSLYSASGAIPTTQCLTTLMPGIARALELMTAGESRRVWVSGAMAIPPSHKSNNGDDDEAPPCGPLALDLMLTGILKAPLLAVNRLTAPAAAFHLPSDVEMEVIEPGVNGRHPDPDSKVTLNYATWNERGTLLETSMMQSHPVTLPMVNISPGWRDALMRMTPGERARVWTPAELLPGEHPARRIYELQLVAVH